MSARNCVKARAVPCSSPSTSSTSLPCRDCQMARFTASVVLPTPPLTLPTAKIEARFIVEHPGDIAQISYKVRSSGYGNGWRCYSSSDGSPSLRPPNASLYIIQKGRVLVWQGCFRHVMIHSAWELRPGC